MVAVEATSLMSSKLICPKVDGSGPIIVALTHPVFEPVQIPIFA